MGENFEVVDEVMEVVEESTESKGGIAPVILGGAALLTCVVAGTMYLVKKLKKTGKKTVEESAETEDTDEFLDEDIAEEDV